MSEHVMPFDHWALVEIFGHTRLAGRVQEATVGGCAFVRVDVPATARHPAFSRLYGQGAIYSITLVTEEVARLAAEQVQERPLTVYLPPRSSLQAGGRDAYDDGGDDREYDGEED